MINVIINHQGDCDNYSRQECESICDEINSKPESKVGIGAIMLSEPRKQKNGVAYLLKIEAIIIW